MSIQRRPVRVATVSHRPTAGTSGPKETDRLMQEAGAYLVRASRMGADLVAFPEIYPQLALADPYHHAEPTEGGSLDRIRELARSLNLLIVWPRVEYDPGRGVRNTSVLVDRSGEIVGRYDKMFPTVTELAKGVIPGTEARCFETDIGRVGLLICFDLNFPEVRDMLRQGSPDVVVFSSMYRGGLQAQALAFELGAFVVTSITSELGLVIDRCGRVLKESTYEALAVAPINTNSIAVHMDFNRDKMDRMLEKYGRELTFDFHTREAFMVIESTGSRDVAELVREFELETAPAYFARSRAERAKSIESFRGKSAKAAASVKE
jgi:predicted amidohydrolase